MKGQLSRTKLGILAVLAIGLITTGTSVIDGQEQRESPPTLVIETNNQVIYRFDTFDASLLGTQTVPTPPLPLRPFMSVIWLADVVAVNGVPARGSLAVRGQAITGAGNSVLSDWTFNIQHADGSPVGMLVASGWAFGAPPASFESLFGGNLAVTGGTGAFFGVRGEGGQSAQPTAQRFASVVEDPAIRGDFGGAARTFAFRLIPSGRLNLE